MRKTDFPRKDGFCFMLWTEVKIHTTTAGIEPVSGILLMNGINGYAVEDSEAFKSFLENKEVYFDYVEDELLKLRDCETTVTYYMREAEGTDATIEYDPVIYQIVIDLNKKEIDPSTGNEVTVPVNISSFKRLKAGGDPTDPNDYLTADKFVFNNAVKFALPETGGVGNLPFIVGGGVSIASALYIAFAIRRKEQFSQNLENRSIEINR